MKIIGIILIGIGIAALIFQFSNKKVLSSVNGQRSVPTLGWPMYVGALSMAAGSFILLGKKKDKL